MGGGTVASVRGCQKKKFSKVGGDFYKGRYLYMGFIQEKRTGGGCLYIKGPSKKKFKKKFLFF
jgi:hypothetical protein